MIYVTGDTHGELGRLQEFDKVLKAGDYCIVCGDFCYVDYQEKKTAGRYGSPALYAVVRGWKSREFSGNLQLSRGDLEWR